jgi:hypothetical protein
MKPVRAIDLTHASPVDGRGHGRTRTVELLISERNALIRDAARFYPGCTDRETARQMLIALARIAMAAGFGIASRRRARRSIGANWCRFFG